MAKLNTKTLNNKYVLYFLFFLTILFFGYIINKNKYDIIVVFLLTGVLARCYTGNMVYVMFSALLISTIYWIVNSHPSRFLEGLENAETTTEAVPTTTTAPAATEAVATTTAEEPVAKPPQKKQQAVVPENETPTQANPDSAVNTPQTEEFGMKKNKTSGTSSSRIDYAGTVEEAYKNLDKLVGKGGIENLSNQTNKLLEHQTKLVDTMKNLSPMMEKVQSLIGTFDSMSPLQPKQLVNA
jgi:hypothetical protein